MDGLALLVNRTSVARLCAAGLALRVAMVLYSYFHDAHFTVRYTDIDYDVVTDGAKAMWRDFPSGHSSPFERVTYRYTPLLAFVMLPNVFLAYGWGKLLLSACDVAAAWYAFECFGSMIGAEGLEAESAGAAANWRHPKLLISAFLLFNPIVINVSTRGNSDMIITFLVIASLAQFARKSYFAAGASLGVAIHMKIYPVIFVPVFFFALLHRVAAGRRKPAPHTPTAQAMIQALFASAFWQPLLSAAVGVTVFAGAPTLLCYLWYGRQYLDEAVFYHVGRLDHRHNFSPYWYPLYIGMAVRDVAGALGPSTARSDEWLRSGLIAFIPQFGSILVAAWALRRQAVHAVAVCTVIFVAFNKVCTVQYFVWFLPLLPFVFAKHTTAGTLTGLAGQRKAALGGTGSLATTLMKVVVLPMTWFSALVLWMMLAVKVEFENKPAYLELWWASMLFYALQVTVAAVIARAAVLSQREALDSPREV